MNPSEWSAPIGRRAVTPRGTPLICSEIHSNRRGWPFQSAQLGINRYSRSGLLQILNVQLDCLADGTF